MKNFNMYKYQKYEKGDWKFYALFYLVYIPAMICLYGVLFGE